MRAVRIIKQTISTFLAAQLLFSFGLCGGLCCVKAVELPAPQIAAHEPEENLPPCHRKKAAEKAAAAKRDHQKHSAHQTPSASHNNVGKIAVSVLNRDCCAMKRETPEGESPLSIFAPQTGKLVATFEALPWSSNEMAFGQSQVPIQISATHSPPHTGFQLSLRI